MRINSMLGFGLRQLKKDLEILERQVRAIVKDTNNIQVIRSLGPFKPFNPRMTEKFEMKSKCGKFTVFVDLVNSYMEVQEVRLREILTVYDINRMLNELNLISKGL